MKLATSAFSFTDEWLGGRHTLEELLRRIAASGLGPGVELIGHQCWRSFPVLEDAEVRAFRRLLDELELVPAALGVYVDRYRRSDRALTDGEAVDELSRQITLAGELGFPVARLHAGVPSDVLEGVAILAEEVGVVLATEIQGTHTPGDRAVELVLECRDRLGSESIALALDFSVSMTRLPRSFQDAVVRAGASADAMAAIAEAWRGGVPVPDLVAALADAGATDEALDEARSGLVRFGRAEPDSWLPLVPAIGYGHAKFWEPTEAGDDASVQTARLLSVLDEGGYAGFVTSEWGGNAWTEAHDVDAFALVRQHHRRLVRLIGKAASAPALS